ncbi:MAG: RsiV family protein [Prevotella sp.]|nr:RsiV family protein [Bacteroides sp.]MCM1366443.1 RsiV family protein [Prevotella sp.]MCM1437077.1 RsiV family protein [Prevotella sp.]
MKFNKTVIIAAAATLTLAACTESKQSDTSGTTTDMGINLTTYTYDGVAIDKSDSIKVDSLRNWRISGDYVLPERIGKNDITALRDSLASLSKIKISSGKVVPVLSADMESSKLDPSKTNTVSLSVNSLSVDLISSTLIVWENYSYEYQVYMAHGMAETNYVNYSIADNKILNLGDLMKKGYEPVLLGMIRDELKNNHTNLLEPIEDIQMPPIFRIKASSIEFIYPVMSIAAYSEGDIRIKLSVMDLADLLTPKGERLILGMQQE